jgi:peptidylprolyl isomerase
MPRRFAATATLTSTIAAVLLVAGCGTSFAPEPPPVVTPSATTRPPDPGPLKVTVNNAKDLSKRPNLVLNRGAIPTQLTTTDIIPGTGRAAAPTDTITAQYVGVIARNGQEFDATWDNNAPAVLQLPRTVPGFRQGVTGMKEGGRREIIIPPALAYGGSGAGSLVGPNETLIYIVDLIKIN